MWFGPFKAPPEVPAEEGAPWLACVPTGAIGATRRYCHHCDIGTNETRCWACGRFTSGERPTHWHKSTSQTQETVPHANANAQGAAGSC